MLGGVNDVCRKVAEGYGYKHVFTPLDIKAAFPEYVSFDKWVRHADLIAQDLALLPSDAR